MNWYIIAERTKNMTMGEALSILGLERGATEDDIKNARNKLAMLYHSDKVGPEKRDKMIMVNLAFEYLQKSGFNTSSEPESRRQDGPGPEWWSKWEKEPERTEVPPWQTDPRSSYNIVGDSFGDQNFCKKAIYEEAIKHGDVERWTLYTWDGSFFRAMLVVFANHQSLGFAGEVIEQWENYHKTVAVFAWKGLSKTIKLIRHNGQDVSSQDQWFQHEALNSNPGNDSEFVREMKERFSR